MAFLLLESHVPGLTPQALESPRLASPSLLSRGFAALFAEQLCYGAASVRTKATKTNSLVSNIQSPLTAYTARMHNPPGATLEPSLKLGTWDLGL